MTSDLSDVDRRLDALLDEIRVASIDRPVADALRLVAEFARDSIPCAHVAVRLTYDDGSWDDRLWGDAESAVPGPVDGDTLSGDDLVRVPVASRGKVVAELLLAGLNTAGTLSNDERRRAESVATTAAAIIERARTTAANRRREEWYESGIELSKEIVASRSTNPYQMIVDRVTQVARADSASLLQLGKTEDSYVIVAASGPSAGEFIGREIVVEDSITTQVMATGRPMSLPRLLDVDLPQNLRGRVPDDSVTVVPLLGSGAQRGVIVITRKQHRTPMSAAEMSMAAAFAATVALALELAESQTERDELVLLEERDRIARDLHDHVIQRLYAIGLSMQSLANDSTGSAERRLASSVDDIDETIKQIRSTIFRLTSPLISAERSLRARTEALLDELTPALGFRPRLVTNGPVDFGVDDDVVDDCDAVLREAVTNVARHAAASEAEVAISVSASQLRLEIRDNGRGLGATVRRSGLANLRARAEAHDGFMQVRAVPGNGTWLLWSIPLPRVRSAD